jgi:hypothetical protein
VARVGEGSNRNRSASLKTAEYPFPSSNPKFLGYVVQKYRPRSGAPSRAFQKWIDQLEYGVGNVLIPALEASEMMMAAETYERAGFSPAEPLLQMPDFNSLIAIALKSTKCRYLN